MQTSLLHNSDIKFVYDSKGVKREVIIGYETFQEIEDFLARHAYFYSEEVQERLRQSEEDLETGRYTEVNAQDVDSALEWLHE